MHCITDLIQFLISMVVIITSFAKDKDTLIIYHLQECIYIYYTDMGRQ